jgi:hypothetical protein
LSLPIIFPLCVQSMVIHDNGMMIYSISQYCWSTENLELAEINPIDSFQDLRHKYHPMNNHWRMHLSRLNRQNCVQNCLQFVSISIIRIWRVMVFTKLYNTH